MMDGGVVSDEVYFFFIFSFTFISLAFWAFCFSKHEKNTLCVLVFMGSRHEMNMGETETEQKV